MKKQDDKGQFYPDINDYLDSTDNSKSVDVKGLEEFVYKICAFTGLSYDESSLVLKNFFQCIRNSMLRGDIVSLNSFGKFFVSSPKCSNNKEQIFIKFEPYPKLSKKVNGRNK